MDTSQQSNVSHALRREDNFFYNFFSPRNTGYTHEEHEFLSQKNQASNSGLSFIFLMTWDHLFALINFQVL